MVLFLVLVGWSQILIPIPINRFKVLSCGEILKSDSWPSKLTRVNRNGVVGVRGAKQF